MTGRFIEAQLLETLVINQIGMASLIASKAARSVIAAKGVDWSTLACAVAKGRMQD